MEPAVLEPPTTPPECLTCGRTFANWPLLGRHVRLDHPAPDGAVLTVAEILAARSDDSVTAGPITTGTPRSTARIVMPDVPPWLLALVVWMATLYGLSNLGYALAALVGWSVVVGVVVGGVALHLWGRAESKLQSSARRSRRES